MMDIRLIQQSTGIPVHLCDRSGVIFESTWSHVTPFFFSYLADQKPEGKPVLLALPSFIWVCLAEIGEQILILGPVITREIAEWDFCTELSGYPFFEETGDIFRQIQTDGSFSVETLKAAACLSVRLFTGQILTAEAFEIREKPIREGFHERTLTETQIDIDEEMKYHLPEAFLHNMVSCIREGNYEGFLNLFKVNLQGIEGTFSKDRDRDKRYHFVYSAAIAHYAAILGGLDYERSCRIAEYFCKKADEKGSTAEMEMLHAEMIRVFCDSVTESRRRTEYSPLVNNCIRYVRANVMERLLIADIAEVLGVSSKWLSVCFYEDTGEQLKDFVHREKLREAGNLLKYTNYSIAQVSNLLNYGSESYFIRLFKKQYQMTPLDYRHKRRDRIPY